MNTHLKENNNSKKGKASPTDEQIGERLKAIRKIRNITQENLASQVGITFQQVQKYENGKNRISASRLYDFSLILQVPFSFFFETFGNMGAAPIAAAYGLSDNTQEPLAGYSEEEKEQFQSSSSIIPDDADKEELNELIGIYYSLKDPQSRKSLLKLVKEMANNMKK